MSDPHQGADAGAADESVSDRLARARKLANLQDTQDEQDHHDGQESGNREDSPYDIGSARLDAEPRDAAQDASGQAMGGKGEVSTLQPLYLDVESWVALVFAPTFLRRRTSTFRWCAQWWRHPEAIVRLESMWRSWEVLRLDPTTGTGTWLTHYVDPQLPILTGAAGTFADCDSTRHQNSPETALPVEAAEPGWWP